MRLVTILFATVASMSLGWSTWAQDASIGPLPSEKTAAALRKLRIDGPSDKKTEPIELKVDLGKVPNNQRANIKRNTDGSASVPFIVPNAMIVQFSPDVGYDDINAFLKERSARVVSKQEAIGTVQIETDLSKYFKAELGDSSANDMYLRGISDAIADFKNDPRIISAAPDLLLAKKQITNVAKASNARAMAGSAEAMDWGIADIEADKLWSMEGADGGVIFGVMDVGFARHEDIVFSRLESGLPVDDHGNHVAAIACGRHNGKGVRGVIPNCFVRPKATNFFQGEPGGDVLAFVQSFGQILGNLNEFMLSGDEVLTVNVSMGYNWIPNFNINPDSTASKNWRQVVASQGEIFISTLRLAKDKNKVVFSAAGNDSDGLSNPIDAKFASPMNWATIVARERNIAHNGFVVEAHDRNGRRAPFSNEKGHLSCPGVNILSAVAHNSSKQVAHDQYAEMSGTSMASPYCAAALSLFALVRPGYTGAEIGKCFVISGPPSSSGTPMLKLSKALQACPPKS